MLYITANAQREFGTTWSVWKPRSTGHPVLQAHGNSWVRKAKLLFGIPGTNKGVFWTYGNRWIE